MKSLKYTFSKTRNKLNYYNIFQRKKSLQSISPIEKPICRQLRAQLSMNSPILLSDGTHYIFLNRLTYYDTLLCIEGKLTTVEELEIISKELFINGRPLCPMIVWATKDGEPTLVRVKSGYSKAIQIKKTPSLYCLAYAIYVI